PSGRGTRRKKISECPRHDRPLSKHKSRVEIDLRFSQQCEEFLLERPLAMMLFLTGNVLFWRGVNTWFGARGALGGSVLRLIEVHELRARLLLQGELIIPDRLIDHQLVNDQPDGVLLPRAVNLNHRGKADAVVVPIDLIGDASLDFARRVENNLVMGNQVFALEYDLAEQIPACVRVGAADNINDII